jgi:hypothetical protein
MGRFHGSPLGSITVVRQDVAQGRLERLGLDEADAIPARIRAQDPRSLFHLAERGAGAIAVDRAARDGKRDAGALGQAAVLDDFVAEAAGP